MRRKAGSVSCLASSSPSSIPIERILFPYSEPELLVKPNSANVLGFNVEIWCEVLINDTLGDHSREYFCVSFSSVIGMGANEAYLSVSI